MSERLDVRTIARGRWRGILLSLGLDERTLSGKHGPCPMCGGKDRFRFDDREGRGTFYCSGCGAGDGVQLAIGVTGLQFREVAQRIEQLAGAVQPMTTKPGRSDDDKLAALRHVYRESAPIADGDEAVKYLRGRGLRLDDIPLALRLHPALPYYDGGKHIGTFKAMLALVTDPAGRAVSLHRTYLQDAQKAPVPAPKKLMEGLPLAGAAIRLTPVSECLGISEGVETAIAAYELFEVPTWSCISTSGIESFEPPEGVRELIVFADHDRNFAGQKAAYAVAHRLALRGIDVEVQVPPEPGDWLDHLLRKKA
ncbi:MAG TPA: primase-helicase zinc-binding domain-containing protein [Rhodocyclaceae bacterium]|nr:primase-helicase zinc-binding domain-containing protein [Rhodocyclaceae bacterium]